MNENKRNFLLTAIFLALFIIFTTLISYVDIRAIGPEHSSVGFALLNRWFHNAVGTHMMLYYITDWASILAVLIVMGFGVLGLCQLIHRRSLLKVDKSILILGGFYILVMGAYVFFEMFVINYRPVLIDGFLEASYPSSTTMLVMCIMPTAIMQFSRLLKNEKTRKLVCVLCVVFTILMVCARLLSGVHWLTDIIGGILLSITLVMLDYSVLTLSQS